ncbi:hypothetical protein ABFS83_03G054800 [Erythranthe nasuta]
MKQLVLILFPLLFLFFAALTSGQSTAAAAPATPGPTNLTAILEKAGRFTIFIRLLQSTKVADQIYTQLNNSNQGHTQFLLRRAENRTHPIPRPPFLFLSVAVRYREQSPAHASRRQRRAFPPERNRLVDGESSEHHNWRDERDGGKSPL